MNNRLWGIQCHTIAKAATKTTAAQRYINRLEQIRFSCAIWSDDYRPRIAKSRFVQMIRPEIV